MMFDEGIIKTREDMEHHPRKNEITNALGMRHMQPPAVCSAPIEPEAGNCFLLCSDGLTGMVSDEQILRVISKHGIPIQQRAETLVQMANDNGGADNITVELVEFPNNVQDIVGGGRKKTFNRKKMILYTLPVLVILGGIAWYILTQVLHPKKPVEKEETEIFSEKTEPCTIYTADSVVFKKNTKCTANIPDFPKNDAVKQDSIKWDSRYIKTVEIEQDTITVVWREDAPLSNIEVTCETLAGKKCIIMIAIKQNVGLPESVQKDRKTKKLDAVTYQLETWIPVKIADKSIVLKKGQRAKTNDVQRVSCKVIDENTFNIKFLKKDYPDSVKVTIETEKVTYTFVIPVNPVQESENADENGADGKGDNRDKGATKTDPSNTLNLRNDSSTIEIIQY
jgi:hypothetical protein